MAAGPSIGGVIVSGGTGTGAVAALVGHHGSVKSMETQDLPPFQRGFTLITPNIDDEDYIEVSDIESGCIGVDVDHESLGSTGLGKETTESNNSAHLAARRTDQSMMLVLSKNVSTEDSEDEAMAQRSQAALGGHSVDYEVPQANRLANCKHRWMMIQSDDASVEVSDMEDDVGVACDSSLRGGRFPRTIDVVDQVVVAATPASRSSSIGADLGCAASQLTRPVTVGKPRADPQGTPPIRDTSFATMTTKLSVLDEKGVGSAVVTRGFDAVETVHVQHDDLGQSNARGGLKLETHTSPMIEDRLPDDAETTNTNGYLRSADSKETVEFVKTTKFEVGLDGRRNKITQETTIYADGSTEVKTSKGLS